MKTKEELDAYLARIRKTLADSKNLMSQVELRFAETDRLLEKQGLTREQVRGMRFTGAQREAANRELSRLGMEELDFDAAESGGGADDDAPWRGPLPATGPGAYIGAEMEGRQARQDEFSADNDELANRRMKFSMMMKPFRI